MSGNKSNGDNDNGNIVSFFSWTMAAPVTVIIRQTVVFKRFGNLALWGATRGEVIQNSAWRKHQFVHWRPEREFLLQEKQSSRLPSELATLTGASARLLAREQWGTEPAKAFRVWLIQQQSIGIDDQPNLAFVAPMFSVRQKFIKIQFGPQNCKHKFISVCLESIKQVVNPMTWQFWLVKHPFSSGFVSGHHLVSYPVEFCGGSLDFPQSSWSPFLARGHPFQGIAHCGRPGLKFMQGASWKASGSHATKYNYTCIYAMRDIHW